MSRRPSSRLALTLGAAAAASLAVLPALPALAAPPPGVRGADKACPDGRVTAGDFSDVEGNLHGKAIKCLAWYGIAQGTADGSYAPRQAVTRAQMATFLMRVLAKADVDVPADAPDAFSDDEGSTHEDNLDALAALGIVQGKTDGTVNPDAPVQRDQMASFLVRLLELVEGTDVADDVEDFFDDDDDNVHQGAINALHRFGIAAGRAKGIFDPKSDVLREQMAAFLARLVDRLVEDGDVDLPASLRLSAEEVLPGDVVQGVVLGDAITSVELRGCSLDGVVTDEDADADGIQFSFVVPDTFGGEEAPEDGEEAPEDGEEAPEDGEEVPEDGDETDGDAVAAAEDDDEEAEDGRQGRGQGRGGDEGRERSGDSREDRERGGDEDECEFVVLVTFEDGSVQALEAELEYAEADEAEDGEESEDADGEDSEDSDEETEDTDGDEDEADEDDSTEAPAAA